jgi:LacI family transcriptional regulator
LVDELSRFADTLGESDDPPTAVCVVNDFLAEFFIEVLHDRGISVPEDLSVVGFDDLERYQAQTPFLTTVRQPFESIGTRAAELLVRRISAPQKQASVFQHVLMPTNLIIRLSTRAL